MDTIRQSLGNKKSGIKGEINGKIKRCTAEIRVALQDFLTRCENSMEILTLRQQNAELAQRISSMEREIKLLKDTGANSAASLSTPSMQKSFLPTPAMKKKVKVISNVQVVPPKLPLIIRPPIRGTSIMLQDHPVNDLDALLTEQITDLIQRREQIRESTKRSSSLNLKKPTPTDSVVIQPAEFPSLALHLEQNGQRLLEEERNQTLGTHPRIRILV